MTRPFPLTLVATLASAVALMAAGAGPAAAADAPSSTIDGPAGVIKQSTATYTFGSDEPAVHFECQIDGGAFEACTSPWTVTLADGPHTLAIRAIDDAGNVDPTPAQRELTVDTSGVDTQLDGGPAGLTNDPTPTFAFGTTLTGATYECRITGAGTPLPSFAGCSTPFRAPTLRDGDYAFEVRAVSAAGKVDPTPATRAFRVDATAPDTELTEGPAEGGESPTRTPRFAYRSSEPAGAQFQCRVDNTQKQKVDLVDWKACDPGGFTTPMLRGGLHTFEVRALDAAGNADASPVKRTFMVRACEQDVRFGLVELHGECIQGTGTDDAPTYESEKPITLNGLPIPVPGGTKAMIVAPVGEADGKLTIKDVTLTPLGVQLYKGDLSIKLPAGKQGEEKEAVAFAPSGKLFGMPVAGKAALRLSWPQGTQERRAILALSIALPELFKSGPSATATSVTGDVGIRIDPTHGIQLDGFKVEVGNAYIGALAIKTMCLSYLRAGAQFVQGCQAPKIGKGASEPFITCNTDVNVDRWDGSLAIILPTASKTELGVWGGTSDGRFSHGGAYADNLGTAVPLAPGVFLNRIAFGICVNPAPLKLKGELGVALGPVVNGVAGVQLNGYLEYTAAYNRKPWQLKAGGDVTLFGYRAADGEMTYLGTGMLDFKFRAGFDFKVAKINGSVVGWVETTGSKRFNVEGKVEVCAKIIGCVRGDALVSSVGVAGCAHVDTFLGTVHGGAGLKWGGKVKIMAGSCDIGPWRAKRSGVITYDAEGRPLQAPSLGFLVADRQPAIAVRVRGRGGIPKVAFVGPDGRRISTDVPDGQGYDPKSHMIMGDEEAGEVSALIANPAKGAWRIEVLPGSVPVEGTDVADPLPQAELAARVTGSGRDRAIEYAYVPVDGRAITFSELGPQTKRELGTVRGGERCERAADRAAGRVCGTLRFTPGMGGAGTRTIHAQLTQDAQPVDGIDVTTYVAPKDALPAKPRITVSRGPGSVKVRWKRSATADQVNVVVATADGRRVLFVRDARHAGSVVLHGVRSTVAARVIARGMRTADSKEGRAATATLRAKKAKKHNTKTTKTTKTTRTGSHR
jgi:hypothetical protein